jgi:hypothetical protein
MDTYSLIIQLCSILTMVMGVLIILKATSCQKYEKYVKFPQPDRRVLKGSIDCTYALNGGNTAYCNQWLTEYRNGNKCTNDGYEICCQRALKCCNQIATCGGGKDCRDKLNTPTKENSLMYDSNVVMDE